MPLLSIRNPAAAAMIRSSKRSYAANFMPVIAAQAGKPRNLQVEVA
jgi:hypothetical protein